MRIVAFAIALTLGTPPALAQTETTPNQEVGDANERICGNLTVIGSRLAVKRVCATRAEWAGRKRQDREVTEQAEQRHCTTTTYGKYGEGTTC